MRRSQGAIEPIAYRSAARDSRRRALVPRSRLDQGDAVSLEQFAACPKVTRNVTSVRTRAPGGGLRCRVAPYYPAMLVVKVLGKVATGAHSVPRGADVKHRVRVRREWLETGLIVDVELPRNLMCAGCEGGGCDACDRSGAITLRGRDEPPEVVQVTLPQRTGLEQETGIVLRIPEQGGLPKPEFAGLPRGLLLLTVVPSKEADPAVQPAEESQEASTAARAEHEPSVASSASTPKRDRLWLWVAIGLAAWVMILLALRLSGCR